MRSRLFAKDGVGAAYLTAAALRCLLIVFGFSIAACAGAAAGDGLQARDYRMAGDATHMRLVVTFNIEPDLHWFLVRAPHRLVIEMPATKFAFEPGAVKARGLIKSVQYGASGPDNSRIILSTKGPFTIAGAEVLPNGDGDGYRLAVDIVAASAAAFEAALADQAITTASTIAAAKSGRVGPLVDRPAKPFTIVVDAGHGGVDGGAEGVGGTIEKDVTLAFALQLRDALAADQRYAVSMTRDRDEFLRLDDRVRIARQAGADLFISIHADTISVKGLRGATVYTVSDHASDAESQAVADRENLSDQLAGIEVRDQDHQVADILVDLIRRETHAFSIRFAKTLVGELSNSVGLINNPHRFAGFKVLKAPDVPSVLVELGYLSNAEDEEQLNDPEWRKRAVGSISSAVAQFAAARAAGG